MKVRVIAVAKNSADLEAFLAGTWITLDRGRLDAMVARAAELTAPPVPVPSEPVEPPVDTAFEIVLEYDAAGQKTLDKLERVEGDNPETKEVETSWWRKIVTSIGKLFGL